MLHLSETFSLQHGFSGIIWNLSLQQLIYTLKHVSSWWVKTLMIASPLRAIHSSSVRYFMMISSLNTEVLRIKSSMIQRVDLMSTKNTSKNREQYRNTKINHTLNNSFSWMNDSVDFYDNNTWSIMLMLYRKLDIHTIVAICCYCS